MLKKIKASLKPRLKKAYQFYVRQYGEDRECSVYSPRRSKIVAWRALGRWLMVSIFYTASRVVEGAWSEILLLPVGIMAFFGSISVVQQATAFKVGWFAGNVDLSTTIKKHEYDIPAAVEEQTLRMNFVLEGLGVGRREDIWKDDDGQSQNH